MSRIKTAAIATAACLLLSAGAAWWRSEQERHDAQCAPVRADAKTAGKIDVSPLRSPDPGDLEDLQRTMEEGVASVQAYRTASAARNTVISENPSCFEDREVTLARAWLRQNERRDEDVQEFWYCWDEGDSRPHRIGRHVAGDHKCTWAELREAGVVTG